MKLPVHPPDELVVSTPGWIVADAAGAHVGGAALAAPGMASTAVSMLPTANKLRTFMGPSRDGSGSRRDREQPRRLPRSDQPLPNGPMCTWLAVDAVSGRPPASGQGSTRGSAGASESSGQAVHCSTGTDTHCGGGVN